RVVQRQGTERLDMNVVMPRHQRHQSRNVPSLDMSREHPMHPFETRLHQTCHAFVSFSAVIRGRMNRSRSDTSDFGQAAVRVASTNQPPRGVSMRMRKLLLVPAIGLLAASASLHAQTAVTAAPDVEALFTSKDPKLNANKQVAYKIIKELLECNH